MRVLLGLLVNNAGCDTENIGAARDRAADAEDSSKE